jgi:hypothetical protein
MAIFANVIAVSYSVGNPFFNIVVAIRKGIDNAARNGADFGLLVTLTYVDGNGTVDTLNSGRLSIGTQTQLLGTIDNRTDSITFQLPLQVAPGANPSYSTTAQVLHRDPTTGNDVELGPAE